VNFGGCDRVEIAFGLVGEDAGDGGFAGSGRAFEQDAGGSLYAEFLGEIGLFEHQLHLPQFALGFSG